MSVPWLGDGSDGYAVLDGITDVPWAVRSGRLRRYLMTRDAHLLGLVIEEGVTVDAHPDAMGVNLRCQGEIINRGTMIGQVEHAEWIGNEGYVDPKAMWRYQ